MKKLIVSTDCTCDLPEELIEKYEIEQMFFYVLTESGAFRDRAEITAYNVFECMQDGQKVRSLAPPVEEYIGYFNKLLRKAAQVIHLTISSGCSQSYSHAIEAVERMGEAGKAIHVIDSRHLSTGHGLLVLRTINALDEGKSIPEVIAQMEEVRDRISSSFITRDAEYLYINGKVSEWKAKLIKKLRVHPILVLKNGEITVKGFIRGNYEKAQLKYVKNELKNHDGIDKNILFITQAGCTVKEIQGVKSLVNTMCSFQNVYVTNASATVSSNCGPGTVGVLYMNS